eukprot:gnl/Chilomastix_caulleri/5163.p3 GENE.gnl/Chilomastix_caulleri/5163~~gnl/Chilomastix_caulleri/5163.p3  ORF type:complete len:51 (-),score=0.45 gnl/Chilomastix_caulleri/5163:98-250(-)
MRKPIHMQCGLSTILLPMPIRCGVVPVWEMHEYMKDMQIMFAISAVNQNM